MKSERARLSLSHYGHVAAIFSLVLFKRMSEYWCKNPVPKKILEIDVCTLMSTRMGTGCRHVQSDEISHTAGFVNCFQTVPEVYLPHGIMNSTI